MGGKLVYILDAEGIFDQMDANSRVGKRYRSYDVYNVTSTCSGSSMAQVQLPGSRESARIKLAYSFALSFTPTPSLSLKTATPRNSQVSIHVAYRMNVKKILACFTQLF
jgi:hypothetical protein